MCAARRRRAPRRTRSRFSTRSALRSRISRRFATCTGRSSRVSEAPHRIDLVPTLDDPKNLFEVLDRSTSERLRLACGCRPRVRSTHTSGHSDVRPDVSLMSTPTDVGCSARGASDGSGGAAGRLRLQPILKMTRGSTVLDAGRRQRAPNPQSAAVDGSGICTRVLHGTARCTTPSPSCAPDACRCRWAGITAWVSARSARWRVTAVGPAAVSRALAGSARRLQYQRDHAQRRPPWHAGGLPLGGPGS